jgi:hypothetical protein
MTQPPQLRLTIAFSAGLNLLIGAAFLFGPELGIRLWPSPLPREMMSFAGLIVLTNGVGAAMMIRRSTWQHPSVLLVVGLVYSLAIFLGLVIHVLPDGAPPVFWVYLAINTLFLVPAAYFFWQYERAR